MTTLSKHIIRLACDPISQDAVVDKYTEERPFIRSGEDVEFQIGLFNRGSLVDTTGITSLVLEIRQSPSAASYLFQATATSLSSLTLSTWLDDSAQHVTLSLPAASNTFSDGGYNILIYAYTATTRLVVLSSAIDVYQTVLGGTAPTPTSSFYTKAEVDSLVSGAGFDSPLTTKGDILTYSTTEARLPVGTDGQILSADSTETTGLKWIAAPPVYSLTGFYPKLYGVTSTTEVTSSTRFFYSVMSKNSSGYGLVWLYGTGTFDMSSGFTDTESLQIKAFPFTPSWGVYTPTCTATNYQSLFLQVVGSNLQLYKATVSTPFTVAAKNSLQLNTNVFAITVMGVMPVSGLS